MISQRRLRALALVAVALVAFVYYAPSLRFGFFNDDPTGHFRWMAGRSIWSLLTDATGHGYYRPLSFVLWQVLASLVGWHDAFILHLLNVLTHAVNAALVGWLAHRLTRRLAFATTAGLLFALYPFSYEAVPYVGSFVHPLVTLLMLLTLVFFLEWQASHARWAFVAAHVALALAVLVQENAVITPLLLVALSLLNLAKTDKPSQGWAYTLSFFAEPVIFAVIWLLVPKTVEARTISLGAMRANVLPFVQALVYPVAPLANHNARTLTALALLSLVALSALAWRTQSIRVLGWGILIWLLASLPSILILDNTYVLGSPRLFYVASVGVAIVWATPMLAFRTQVKRTSLEWGIAGLILLLGVVPTLDYVRCQINYQSLAGDVGKMMAQAVQSTPESQAVTFVNLPYYFSSRGPGTECRSPFVFAPTGAVVIPPYADARDFVLYNGGPDRPTLSITVNDYQPGWQTFGAVVSVGQMRQRLAASHVFVFDLVRWRLFDLSAAWQPNGTFSPTRFTLDTVRISNIIFQMSNGQGVVSLTWQTAEAAPDVKVFAHVYDASGKLVRQDDGWPADGFVPTAWQQPGDVITDTRTIPLANLPAGTYRVTAGLYHAASGTRLEASDASGARLPDDEIPVTQIVR